jgi:hypothetical protein
MLTPLTLAAALAFAPAQPAGLALTNVRFTFGELGSTRVDGRYLPGDVMFLAYDIENLTMNANGVVSYTMAMEVLDGTNKAIFKQDPAAKTDFVPLGGKKLPAKAFITIGFDQPAGTYACRITVTDAGSKASQVLERKFEVLKRDYGIVAVYTSADEQGAIPAPTTGIVGQQLFVQFAVAGFGRDAQKKPNLQIEMITLDERGQPNPQNPRVETFAELIDEKQQGVHFRFPLPLTRAGKYTVRLKATDKTTNKTTQFDLPLAVVPPAN